MDDEPPIDGKSLKTTSCFTFSILLISEMSRLRVFVASHKFCSAIVTQNVTKFQVKNVSHLASQVILPTLIVLISSIVKKYSVNIQIMLL